MSENISTSGEQVPNYLWQAIVVTILCCLPFGIPAIIFSTKVNTMLAQGDAAGAKEASSKAKMWCWLSLCLGLVSIIIGIILQVLAITATASMNAASF